MNSTDIDIWLKTTITGIIVLGALGSILALVILKLISKFSHYLLSFFTKILPSQASRIKSWVYLKIGKIVHSYGVEYGYKTSGEIRTTIAYFAFHVSRGIGWLIVFALFLNISITIMLTARSSILTLGTFILVVFALLALFYALKHLIGITLLYYASHKISDTSIRKMREEILAEMKAEATANEANKAGNDQDAAGDKKA